MEAPYAADLRFRRAARGRGAAGFAAQCQRMDAVGVGLVGPLGQPAAQFGIRRSIVGRVHQALKAHMPHQDRVLQRGDQRVGLGPPAAVLHRENLAIAGDVGGRQLRRDRPPGGDQLLGGGGQRQSGRQRARNAKLPRKRRQHPGNSHVRPPAVGRSASNYPIPAIPGNCSASAMRRRIASRSRHVSFFLAGERNRYAG